ncbi:hypothetical protein [Phyllobacterium sp. P30BS-XVII]|uniref:hypothetical protein n=1 Tax=Phyllobacterium sp. P30BS-XVII TaxID=2587046 RepID=UPI0015FC2260|nr:hypothetical protein [Phyllobacterium sp. P30BS-XVII]MBA8899505.1 hypothetical protein [Phyllobacterium sp. P30BS-XVII]
MLSTVQSPRTRLILATSGVVPSDHGIEERVYELKGSIISYVSGKLGSLPQNILSIEQYENTDGSISIETLNIPGGNIWAIRFSEPDDETVGRSWSVELTLGRIGDEILMGSRLNCYSKNYDFGFDHSVPRVLRSITDHYGYKDYGIRLTSSVIEIKNEDDALFLFDLIKNKKRWRNVVVVAADDSFNTIANVENMAHKLSGVAHVARIIPDASYHLSSIIGKEYSVFDKGIRIYRPKFSEEDEVTRHPLIIKRILEKAPQGFIRSYEGDIRRDCFRATIDRENLATSVPSFADIRAAASKSRLVNLNVTDATDADILQAEINARVAAESQADASLSLAMQEEELRIKMEAERDSYRAQLYSMRARSEALEIKIAQLGGALEVGSRPTNYIEISEWVESNFPGKLVLHARARKALKSAVYENIDVVCDTLKLLAEDYREVCLGRMRREEFDAILNSNHLVMTGSISEERASEYGHEYFVTRNGRRSFLHGHIEKGNSRDERYCLRIYFLWDSLEEIIVIGWLPSHLKNRLT